MMAGGRTVARPGVLDSPGEYLLVTLLVLLAAAMTGTWATGQLAGLLFRQSWPHAGISQSLSIVLRLPGHLGDPRMAWPAQARGSLPGLAGFAVAAVLTAALMAAAAVVTGRRVLTGRSRRGYASARQIRTRLSEKAVLARADVIRPSLVGQPMTVTDAGVRAGRSLESGMPLAISAESSVLLFAAPRIGKTSQVVIPWLKDWPGPALVTSVRPDVLENTASLAR